MERWREKKTPTGRASYRENGKKGQTSTKEPKKGGQTPT